MLYIIFSIEKRHRIKNASYEFPTTIKYNININKDFLNVLKCIEKKIPNHQPEVVSQDILFQYVIQSL